MGTDLGYALLIGFAGMKLTQLYKEILHRLDLRQMAWWKSLVSLVICLILALVFIPHRDLGQQVLVGLAAAGLSALAHGLDTLARATRDDLVSQVLGRKSPRIR